MSDKEVFFKEGDIYMLCIDTSWWVGKFKIGYDENKKRIWVLSDTYAMFTSRSEQTGSVNIATSPIGDVILNLKTAQIVKLAEKNNFYKVYLQVTSGILLS